MSAAAATLFPPPPAPKSTPKSPCLNFKASIPFRSPRPISLGRFDLVSERTGVRNPRTMIKASAFRNTRDGDERVQVLEQEAFIDSPTELRGLESTLNRLSKWFVAALFGGLLVWRHDAEAMWVAMGSIVNAMLSVGLKRVLNQERPSGVKSDPGMPSSHAQSIFFTVVFAALSFIEWLGVNQLSLGISALALAFGSYFSWLRVSQQFHTVNQVLVGAVVGSIFSILWYFSWEAIVLEAFISSWWVQIIVIFASAGFCLGFLLYVIRYWFRDER